MRLARGLLSLSIKKRYYLLLAILLKKIKKIVGLDRKILSRYILKINTMSLVIKKGRNKNDDYCISFINGHNQNFIKEFENWDWKKWWWV